MSAGTFNLNSQYGQAQAGGIPFTTGKTFFVADSSDGNFNLIDGLFEPDADGVQRRYSTVTAALAACTADFGETVILSPAFTTALTAAELLSAETKGVTIVQAGKNVNGVYAEDRTTATLPATAQTAIFTVTGKIRILRIIGEVTTIIQAQANNLKIVSNPTVGADVDLCAVADVNADAVGTNYNITGTFADALVATTSGAFLDQAIQRAGLIL